MPPGCGRRRSSTRPTSRPRRRCTGTTRASSRATASWCPSRSPTYPGRGSRSRRRQRSSWTRAATWSSVRSSRARRAARWRRPSSRRPAPLSRGLLLALQLVLAGDGGLLARLGQRARRVRRLDGLLHLVVQLLELALGVDALRLGQLRVEALAAVLALAALRAARHEAVVRAAGELVAVGGATTPERARDEHSTYRDPSPDPVNGCRPLSMNPAG